MHEKKTPENEDIEDIRRRVIAAITAKEFPASDVGRVLVSIGAAMLKGSSATEAEFLEYARKAWALQQSRGASPSN